MDERARSIVKGVHQIPSISAQAGIQLLVPAFAGTSGDGPEPDN
jgi:hypothetical protein